ncbi:CcoQ/FixQ family Cbb3-type cytochrome c oxidase assembly chaperone [Pyxidicoccus fallax]|jgi:cytochrome c oxidase cbb3-type subunit 4|uniref:CcoQ/FixQ family Cbb3-type cytochrome c oxidase assembly chaperone n=1 Tax=Pyxidicoccus fallax TaxID=394095 RepID=A0A848LXI6_9BACT|nr:CcoQ/FixQ family Cbb3-type cytochrome c oxidase assembly chaperone [Pyxidicoccus fallax]NMO21964.1 CcoQ/FixQ family Cbb3-type cytochrome c oxidase assembly chaperone [Pyxidicoccus fallax]NPC83435.1 CcoQ/FixQ family Cbb3-type cytochrome c oxidase assembly chaperone [Pyxidicoccus fallax]
MYKQFYQGMALTELPLFALVLFIMVFLGVCAWVFGVRRSRDFDTLARMPLAERGEGGHE